MTNVAMKIVFLVTVAMVMIITVNLINIQQQHKAKITSKEHQNNDDLTKLWRPKRVSRFLIENSHQNGRSNNPKAADHCNKDNEICNIVYGKNTTCCNNKCMDLMEDKHNCGACKNKCKFTQQCCGGQCVDMSYDKRHCGSCNNKCLLGQYCIYGMCDYA